MTNFVGRDDIGQENDRGCTSSPHRKNVTECLGRARALFVDVRGVVGKVACVTRRRAVVSGHGDSKTYLGWSDRTVQPHV